MDKETRERLRQAVDEAQRQKMKRGGLRAVDPGALVARAVEAEQQGYEEVGAPLRKLAAKVELMLAEGMSLERVDDTVYRWLYGIDVNAKHPELM